MKTADTLTIEITPLVLLVLLDLVSATKATEDQAAAQRTLTNYKTILDPTIYETLNDSLFGVVGEQQVSREVLALYDKLLDARDDLTSTTKVVFRA